MISAKIISTEEYERIKASHNLAVVSELDMLLDRYQLVAVEVGDDEYKVIKFPRLPDTIQHRQRLIGDEELPLYVKGADLQKFIFLKGI